MLRAFARRPNAWAIAASLLLSASLSACLAGPSSALGGGPIGRAPDPRSAELLPEPDSTRGQGFILFSNRRDVLDETRVELNAAARAYERLLGARPEAASIRLTSTERDVTVDVRIGTRAIAPFVLPLTGAGRAPEAMRIASGVVLVMSREWLSGFLHDLTPGDTATGRGWMEESRLRPWLRVGLMQSVAENRLHELWLAQLGRQRDSLPSLDQLTRADACDAACLAPYGRRPRAGGENESRPAEDPLFVLEARRGGRPDALAGRALFVASSYGLVQFFSKREGASFIRELIISSLANGDVTAALGAAQSFSASPADIERQWRVWLAAYVETR
ncbi:MAG: hypothetical protein ABIZ91_04835 [Gemmatimonadaceae bacterium]